jgi:geranylgeranyl diphosphate synthase, type II
MLTLKNCQELIAERLKKMALPAMPANLYDPIRYMLEPDGKRIRPALVLMGCNVFADGVEKAVPAAMAIEVFHNFTLMHDDIMDNACMRRNRQAVHIKWSPNIALLSGDAMVIKAYELLSGYRDECFHAVFSLFNDTALKVCEGQQYDMDFETRTDITEQDYLAMVELKTAVLLAASLKMGAIIGGADAREAENLYRFGRNIGIAFQLQDDYLDVYADPDKFGKVSGNDIVSNKKTFLLVSALQQAGGEIKKELLHWLGLREFDAEEKIAGIKRIYSELDIPDMTRKKVRAYHEMARTSVSEMSGASGRLTELTAFSDLLMNRLK